MRRYNELQSESIHSMRYRVAHRSSPLLPCPCTETAAHPACCQIRTAIRKIDRMQSRMQLRSSTSNDDHNDQNPMLTTRRLTRETRSQSFAKLEILVAYTPDG